MNNEKVALLNPVLFKNTEEFRRKQDILEQYAHMNDFEITACYFDTGCIQEWREDAVCMDMLAASAKKDFDFICVEHECDFPYLHSPDIPRLQLYVIHSKTKIDLGLACTERVDIPFPQIAASLYFRK